MFASICLRVLSRIQRGGARLVTDFTPKPLAPVTAADRHALGSLLTGIGFAALGIRRRHMVRGLRGAGGDPVTRWTFVQLGILGATLAFWIGVVAWLANHA